MSTKDLTSFQSCILHKDLKVIGTSSLNSITCNQISTENFELKTTTKKGFVLTSDMNGVGQWKKLPLFSPWEVNKSNENIYYKKAYVGIGLTNAMEMLHVNDNIRVEGSVRCGSIKLLDDNATIMKKRNLTICTNKDKIITITENNNVGINTEDPKEKLVVEGNIKFTGNLINNNNVFNLPEVSDTLIGEKQQQSLYMKTLISSTLIHPNIKEPLIDGNIKLNNHSTIQYVRQPEESHEVATKEYVDIMSMMNHVKFLDNVEGFVKELPKSDELPTNSRYILNNQIVSWDGLEWKYEDPESNNIVFVKSEKEQWIYLDDLKKWITYATIISSHSKLSNLYSDDHIQYLNILGRKDGQIVHGGLHKHENLTLDSTYNINKGNIILNPKGGYVSVNHDNPAQSLDIFGNIRLSGCIVDTKHKQYQLPNNNEESTNLLSTDSIDTIYNKTLVNPKIDGFLEGMRYSVTHVEKSRILSTEQVVLVMSSLSLTLPEASENSGRQFIIILSKKDIKCEIKVMKNDRINANDKKVIILEPHDVKMFVSNGLHRWYRLK